MSESVSDQNSTIISFISQILSQNPHLAQSVEAIAQNIQGKGWGHTTVEQEVEAVGSLLVGTPDLAIDVGGNVGNYSASLRKKYSALEIHIFEPSSANVPILKERFSEDSNVVIRPIALSDNEGVSALYSDRPGSPLGSLTQRKLDHFGVDHSVVENVPTIRFEQYWKEILNRRVVDLVKLDVEGHELSALKGFGDSLSCVKAIQFEFGGCNIDTRTFFQDIWYFFKSSSYNLYRITPIGCHPISKYSEGDEFFSTTNYIAINQKLK
jgi:FkbM family methyltransferase